MFLGYSEDHTQKVYRYGNGHVQPRCTVDEHYDGECTGIKCKYTINEDDPTDEEESEEEDPLQLNMKETKLNEEEQTDETELNQPEKKVTFKHKVELPPGEARNLDGW